MPRCRLVYLILPFPTQRSKQQLCCGCREIIRLNTVMDRHAIHALAATSLT